MASCQLGRDVKSSAYPTTHNHGSQLVGEITQTMGRHHLGEIVVGRLHLGRLRTDPYWGEITCFRQNNPLSFTMIHGVGLNADKLIRCICTILNLLITFLGLMGNRKNAFWGKKNCCSSSWPHNFSTQF